MNCSMDIVLGRGVSQNHSLILETRIFLCYGPTNHRPCGGARDQTVGLREIPNSSSILRVDSEASSSSPGSGRPVFRWWSTLGRGIFHSL